MEFNFVDQGSGFYRIHGRDEIWPWKPDSLIQWSCSGSTLFETSYSSWLTWAEAASRFASGIAGFVLKTGGWRHHPQERLIT